MAFEASKVPVDMFAVTSEGIVAEVEFKVFDVRFPVEMFVETALLTTRESIVEFVTEHDIILAVPTDKFVTFEFKLVKPTDKFKLLAVMFVLVTFVTES
jgi:hypothetical protein